MNASPKDQLEIELKFLVPQTSRAALAAEMARGSSSLERTSLAAMYLDTADRRLARAGLAWRLRREGRRWIQTLKAGGANALERFEHEIIRPGATHDASLHAGTPTGDRLIALLARAEADGDAPGVRFRTEVRRTARRVRTRGAVVEVAFDEGRIVAADATQRIREVEFELVSGSPAAMLAMAERWRKKFGLIHDPRSKAERGDRLADGQPFPALRKAQRPEYPARSNAVDAFGSVLDECLSQVTRNAIGLIEGDPALRVEHVHQLRVGIRRLRSALRSFRGWVPSPPDGLEAGLRALFEKLGESRDSDVMASGVVADLAQAGAPAFEFPAGGEVTDPVVACRANDAQRVFLAWIAWRAALAEAPVSGGPDGGFAGPAAAVPTGPEAAADGSGPAVVTVEASAPTVAEVAAQRGADEARTGGDRPREPAFAQRAARRLARWHKQIVADWKAFDTLEEEALHDLRKRIKRQRYAVEFFAPVLRRRRVDRYLEALAQIQDRMGELNDLFVARDRYQSVLQTHPAAWFALGWLAARIAAVRALARPALGRLARVDPPAS